MRVALVHDYLTQYGGAERVLEALHQMFPAAPVFTSVLDLDRLPAGFRFWEIHESPMGRLPASERYHRSLLPFYGAAFRSFRAALAPFDLVVADSSAWSHQAPAPPDAALLCYCHSPARFLYGDDDYLAPAALPRLAKGLTPPLFGWLRRTDKRAAARVDRYVANSRNVAARILAAYGREATVIYPPVDVARFAPNPGALDRPPESWFLVVSRLVPHKRVDLAVDACSRLGLPLKVVGVGRAATELRRRAGPTIEFIGHVSDEELVGLLQRCRALILPAAEDFGLTAVEAQAAGRPVIALGRGGALESIVPDETGLFFDELTPASLCRAIEAFERRSWNPGQARAHARRFDRARFAAEMQSEIEATLAARRFRSDR